MVASEAACIFVRLFAKPFVSVIRGDATEDLVDQRLLLIIEEFSDRRSVTAQLDVIA